MTPATFCLLVALTQGAQHGYGLIERVDRLTEGEMRLGPGTLYRTLQRMRADGLILESEARGEVDPRRRTYALTGLGERAMHAELDRMERSVRSARAWLAREEA